MFYVKFKFEGKIYEFDNVDALDIDRLYLTLFYHDDFNCMIEDFSICGVKNLFISLKKEDKEK